MEKELAEKSLLDVILENGEDPYGPYVEEDRLVSFERCEVCGSMSVTRAGRCTLCQSCGNSSCNL